MKILLAIDDSPFSRDATRILQQQFRTENVEVRVLSVVEPISAYISADLFPHFTPQVESIEEDRQKQAMDMVSHVAKDLRSAGFQATELIDLGDAKTKIIENAMDWQADLIIMGSHGWKGLNRFLLGSVSDAVARHAPCSVEIVRLKSAPASS